jgi:hypothetical protein
VPTTFKNWNFWTLAFGLCTNLVEIKISIIMKHQHIKSLIIVFIFCLQFSYAQKNELNFKSFSFALGGFQPYSGDNGNANFYASIDGTYAYKKTSLQLL